jgi:hypothetical protein
MKFVEDPILVVAMELTVVFGRHSRILSATLPPKTD